jgi:hypothetical protein
MKNRTIMSNATTSPPDYCRPDQFVHGCSFDDTEQLLFNAIIAITFLVIATVILVINVVVLVLCFIKTNRMFITVTAFANYSTVFIFFYNIIGSALGYISALDFCYNLNALFYFCVIKSCLLYFIGLMVSKMLFLMSVERLISVRWLQKYKQFLQKKYLFITNFFLTIFWILVAFSPLLFNWNHFIEGCDCGLNNVLPKLYVLIMNAWLVVIASLTIFIYLYIYFFVKRSREKISTQIRASQGSADTANTNTGSMAKKFVKLSSAASLTMSGSPLRTDKIQILKSQIILFSIFFGSWMPFFALTTYEAVLNITWYGTVARVRNFSLIFIMVSLILNPVVYVIRLRIMKLTVFRNNNMNANNVINNNNNIS